MSNDQIIYVKSDQHADSVTNRREMFVPVEYSAHELTEYLCKEFYSLDWKQYQVVSIKVALQTKEQRDDQVKWKSIPFTRCTIDTITRLLEFPSPDNTKSDYPKILVNVFFEKKQGQMEAAISNNIEKSKTMMVLEKAFVEVVSNIDQSAFVERKLVQMYNEYQSSNVRRNCIGKPFYYAPYTTISQSSGYGKSRTVELIAHSTSNFYVHVCCLRPKYASGYPPRSSYADMLLKPTSFEQAKRILNNYVNCLIEAANQIENIDFYNQYSVHNQSAKAKELIQHVTNYNQESLLFKPCTKSKKPLLLVFDEARSLIDKKMSQDDIDGSKPCNLFLSYCLALQDMEQPVFALFIDTTPKISNLKPSIIKDPSKRVFTCGSILFPPIYLLPTFDAFRPKSMVDKANVVKIDSIQKAIQFESICSFGRPIWASWLLAKQECTADEETSDRFFFKMSAQKLTGGTHQFPTTDDAFESLENLLTIMSVRVGTIQPVNNATSEKLVSSHMATLTQISSDRSLIEIEYPSEPILALAAAQYFWNSSSDVSRQCTKLASYVRSSMVDKGSIGELVVKIALLHAFDKTKKAETCEGFDSTDSYYDLKSQTVYAKYVTVRDFLISLFGDKVIRLIKDQLDLKQANKLLDGYIYFTHFFKPKEQFKLTDLALMMMRGIAGEYKKNMKYVDLTIPVTFKLDSFQEMSAINIQVNMWADPKQPTRSDLECINLRSCFGGLGTSELPPSLTIYFQQNSKKEPKLISLSEPPSKKLDNLACLYAEGLGSLEFSEVLINALKQLAGCVLNEFDEQESQIYNTGFNPLSNLYLV